MTEQGLRRDLEALGVRAGDLLMVHASMRRLGLASMRGGAELFLDALDAAVGPHGTVMMVLGTHYPMDWVNERPVEERAALLAGSEPFDHLAAPAMADVGVLAEVFRRRPGTIVSDNPSGRFGARGGRAEELLRDVPWHDYYGPGSPLERLCELGGRILRLGADPDTVTALHYAEYLAEVPNKRRTRWDYVLAGRGHCRVECLDDFRGIAEWEGEDYFAVILEAFLAAGRGLCGRVGRAEAELIEAADIVRFGALWMEEHLTGAA